MTVLLLFTLSSCALRFQPNIPSPENSRRAPPFQYLKMFPSCSPLFRQVHVCPLRRLWLSQAPVPDSYNPRSPALHPSQGSLRTAVWTLHPLGCFRITNYTLKLRGEVGNFSGAIVYACVPPATFHSHNQAGAVLGSTCMIQAEFKVYLLGGHMRERLANDHEDSNILLSR